MEGNTQYWLFLLYLSLWVFQVALHNSLCTSIVCSIDNSGVQLNQSNTKTRWKKKNYLSSKTIESNPNFLFPWGKDTDETINAFGVLSQNCIKCKELNIRGTSRNCWIWIKNSLRKADINSLFFYHPTLKYCVTSNGVRGNAFLKLT